jgi:hypothetical protein
VGQVEQFVGGVTHRRNDDDDLVTGILGSNNALCDVLDFVGVAYRRSAILLHD